MAMAPVIKVILVICGFLSIIFLAIGLYAPAWMKYETRIYTDYSKRTTSVSIGLWSVSACIGSSCTFVSINKLVKAIEDSKQPSATKNVATDLLTSFLPMQRLCVLGGLGALFSAILVINYIKQSRTGIGNKPMGMPVAGVILNMTSGFLVILAVAIQAGLNQSFKDDVDAAMMIPEVRQVMEMEVLFPWAILMSGIGAGLIFLLGLVFGIVLYVYRYDESGPSTTNTRNQFPYAVYNTGANLTECNLSQNERNNWEYNVYRNNESSPPPTAPANTTNQSPLAVYNTNTAEYNLSPSERKDREYKANYELNLKV